jgi:hypothetical protein
MPVAPEHVKPISFSPPSEYVPYKPDRSYDPMPNPPPFKQECPVSFSPTSVSYTAPSGNRTTVQTTYTGSHVGVSYEKPNGFSVGGYVSTDGKTGGIGLGKKF